MKLTNLMIIISSWFGVSEEESRRLLEDVLGTMVTTSRYVPTYIAIIASHRYEQSIKSEGNAEIANDPVLREKRLREAGFLKPVAIPKYANGRSKLPANSKAFGDGTYIVVAGSRKNPCIFVFDDGDIVFSTCEDNVQHRVLQAWTTMENDQECHDNRRAA